MIHRNKKRGFTLIELLVVISIIGLLSSVVLASLQSARQKGQVASIIEFDTYNYHKLGANLIAKYDFDEANGATVLDDSSGNGYNIAGIFSMSPNTPLGSGNSLNLRGSTNPILYTLSTPVTVNDLTTSIWVYSTGYTGRTLYNLIGTGSSYPLISVQCNTNNQLVITYRATGGEYSLTILNSSACANLNQWHNITITFGTQKVASSILLYIDGKLVTGLSPITIPASPPFPDNIQKIYIGYMAIPAYDTYVDSFKIYNEHLTASEIGKLYASGLKDHQNLAQK